MADRMLINGRPATALPADDRGLAYGDGIFRTMRVESGIALAWRFHYARLAHDCAALGLETPERERLEADIRALAGDGASGIVKIVITRGSGGRGYAPPGQPVPRRIVSLHCGQPAGIPDALALPICPIVLATPAVLAGVKHLNRLEQVLARRDCERRNLADAAMCDSAGRIVCTTMRNLLFVDGTGDWWTPRLDHAGVIGATRERLRAALPALAECEITCARLGDFVGAVACNSVSGALAVPCIGEHRFAESRALADRANALLVSSH
ncbi:aminodeoxychorismate lyase [Salinisphaera sp. RV14]|uniref:aminodeoxychorismate lyase n=1 Tax=Salinisphaera sp. RV14 TaxID=3454140 RepID=UPI003F827DCD